MSYTPQDALDFAKAFVKNMPVDDVAVKFKILDYAAKMIWMAGPWRWTLSPFNSVVLTAGSPSTTVALPSDFLYLESAFITNGNTKIDLEVVSALPTDATGAIQGNPSQIAVIGTPGTSGQLIAHPVPPVGSNWRLFGTYKLLHPTIDGTLNIASPNPATGPDAWFHVFQEAVLYFAYKYADYTERMGTAQVSANGQVVYTGQLGIVMAAIQDMRLAERLPVQSWTRITPQLRG